MPGLKQQFEINQKIKFIDWHWDSKRKKKIWYKREGFITEIYKDKLIVDCGGHKIIVKLPQLQARRCIS